MSYNIHLMMSNVELHISDTSFKWGKLALAQNHPTLFFSWPVTESPHAWEKSPHAQKKNPTYLQRVPTQVGKRRHTQAESNITLLILLNELIKLDNK